jgi:hypothetical protein
VCGRAAAKKAKAATKARSRLQRSATPRTATRARIVRGRGRRSSLTALTVSVCTMHASKTGGAECPTPPALRLGYLAGSRYSFFHFSTNAASIGPVGYG